MEINKKIISGVALGIASTGIITASALAATNTTGTKYPDIVQKIANKFHLNPADVQSVFQQEHQDRQTKQQTQLRSHLDQAVKDGKLTPDQETKLIAELQKLHDQLKADRKSNRISERQSLRAILDQWAKDNGINNLDQILPSRPQIPKTSGQG